MRHGQFGRLETQGAGEKKVEVERPSPPSLGPDSASPEFNSLEGPEQIDQAEGSRRKQGRVDYRAAASSWGCDFVSSDRSDGLAGAHRAWVPEPDGIETTRIAAAVVSA